MIVIPLVAGEERIGVPEVLNKVDGDSFMEEEHQLLLSIAEETSADPWREGVNGESPLRIFDKCAWICGRGVDKMTVCSMSSSSDRM
jgi:hypothetical protein